jgi:hypothetical protein
VGSKCSEEILRLAMTEASSCGRGGFASSRKVRFIASPPFRRLFSLPLLTVVAAAKLMLSQGVDKRRRCGVYKAGRFGEDIPLAATFQE